MLVDPDGRFVLSYLLKMAYKAVTSFFKNDLKSYVNNKVIPFMEKLGMPTKRVKYGGSGLVSDVGLANPLDPQDSDFWTFFDNLEEYSNFINSLAERIDDHINKGILGGSKGRAYIKKVKADFEKQLEVYHKTGETSQIKLKLEHIRFEENGKSISMNSTDYWGGSTEKITYKEYYFGNDYNVIDPNSTPRQVSNKTDISVKINGLHDPQPSILIR
jgi:hypothetical protein